MYIGYDTQMLAYCYTEVVFVTVVVVQIKFIHSLGIKIGPTPLINKKLPVCVVIVVFLFVVCRYGNHWSNPAHSHAVYQKCTKKHCLKIYTWL